VEFEDFPKVIYLDSFTTEADNLRLLNGAYRIGTLKRVGRGEVKGQESKVKRRRTDSCL